MKGFSLIFIFIILACFQSRSLAQNALSVLNFGAIGDGKADDSKAFLAAWKAACDSSAGSAINVPAGKTFRLSPIVFKGPCKSPSLNFQIQGELVAPNQKWSGNRAWIEFDGVNNLNLNGGGKLDGQGSIWWSSCPQSKVDVNDFDLERCKDVFRPNSILFSHITGLHLNSLTSLNSPKIHISITDCKTIDIGDFHITAPENSPNTDGIDISRSSNIKINHCTIQTGDDCIAINAGVSTINITDVNCGPGHGISVGSLGDHGENALVEDVHVEHCTLDSTTNGVRIKTFQSGSGNARRITFKDITINNAKNPIIIDQFYTDNIIRSKFANSANSIAISDVTFSGIHGTSASEDAIILNCGSPGCSNINLNDVNLTPAKSGMKIQSTCKNVNGKAVNVSPEVSCLTKSLS